MPFCYKKLWIKLIEQDIKKMELMEKANISSNVLAKLGKNEPVSLQSLEKICLTLDCNIGDILDIVREEKEVKI